MRGEVEKKTPFACHRIARSSPHLVYECYDDDSACLGCTPDFQQRARCSGEGVI